MTGNDNADACALNLSFVLESKTKYFTRSRRLRHLVTTTRRQPTERGLSPIAPERNEMKEKMIGQPEMLQ
jgi:hypothetical protein